MVARQLRTILAAMAMALGLLLCLGAGNGVLAERVEQWPHWELPAPLPRPGRGDLVYPAWFLGEWQVSCSDGTSYPVRFLTTAEGVVGDRGFNAAAVGQALLGERLRGVATDPANPNRQIAHLRQGDGGRLELESTVVGRRREQPANGELLVDELALQVLHGPADPAVSRVETLSRFRRQPDGSISGDQWQASYGSPSEGLAASALRSSHVSLRLERREPPTDPASGTGAPAEDCRQCP